MPLPEDFSPWEHLRVQITTAHNLNVQRTFFGIEAGDISSELGAMRTAVFIEDDDTVDMIVLRLILFYFVFQGEFQQAYYATPVVERQNIVKHKPQVHLLFKEPISAFLLENKLQRATAQISFRLMNESSLTMNHAKAEQLATRIHTVFRNFMWEKGTKKYSYVDETNGYHLLLYANSEAVAIGVIEKVVEVGSHGFDEKYLIDHTDHKNYPVVPPLQEIYGKERHAPRRRPITEVKFYKAELSVDGLPRNIVLVSGRSRDNALVAL